VLALEAGETLEMIDVLLRLHDHVARGDRLLTVRTVRSRSEQPADTDTSNESSDVQRHR